MLSVFSGSVHIPGQHGGHALTAAGTQRHTDCAERQKVVTSSWQTSTWRHKGLSQITVIMSCFFVAYVAAFV